MAPPDPIRAAAAGVGTSGERKITGQEIALQDTPDLSIDEAKAITNKIRQNLSVAVVNLKKAYAGRAWIALEYNSWADYCKAEFGDTLRLGRDDRRDLVLELTDAGMSTRAIAAATGASKSTVAADVAGVQNRTPAPLHAPDDPHCWCVTPCPGFGEDHPIYVRDDDIVEAEIVEDEPTNVFGLDGKRYTRKPTTEQPKRRRYPITDSARNLADDIEKLTRKIERFRQDDRIRANREHYEFQRILRANTDLSVELSELDVLIGGAS